MAKVTERPLSIATPKANTFLITVMLCDVKKGTALEIMEMIQEEIDLGFTDSVGDVFVLASHVRDGILTEPAEPDQEDVEEALAALREKLSR